MTYRILQITDCHLFADRRELRGIPTWPRLIAVLDEIRNRFSEFDCLVVTGDTAHDEIKETYTEFREALGELTDRVFLIPGNHDNRDAMVQVFPDRCRLADGHLTFQNRLGDWQLIGLDSHLPGEVAGRLGQAQINCLEESLSGTENRPVVLFVHHPPVLIHSHWVDEIGLEDGAELIRRVSRFSNVKLICSGHVHQESVTATGGPTVLTAPAVGPQFRPRMNVMQIDSLPPALRVIDLNPDGTWSAQVVRVEVEA